MDRRRGRADQTAAALGARRTAPGPGRPRDHRLLEARHRRLRRRARALTARRPAGPTSLTHFPTPEFLPAARRKAMDRGTPARWSGPVSHVRRSRTCSRADQRVSSVPLHWP
ncbi:hypothetical protein GPN2_20603 [Streptomyces murinus]